MRDGFLFIMAGPTGIEPMAYCLGEREQTPSTTTFPGIPPY